MSNIDPEKEVLNNMYRQGYKDAVKDYAVWKDGQQYVGVLARPLAMVLAEVDNSPVPIQ